MKPAKSFLPLAVAFVLLLNSCIGISSAITLSRDGSGTMQLIYRIPLSLESLGKLDGNEKWLTVPVGRADFERTLDRLPGMRMRSFSSKPEGKDLITRVGLEFDDIESLAGFLDATGQGVSLIREQGAVRLSFILSGGTAGADPELLSLVSSLSAGYEMEFIFSAPEEAAITLYSGEGKPIDSFPGGDMTPRGKQVSFKVPMADLLSSRDGLGLEIRWQGGRL
jgi:hypothetical protein